MSEKYNMHLEEFPSSDEMIPLEEELQPEQLLKRFFFQGERFATELEMLRKKCEWNKKRISILLGVISTANNRIKELESGRELLKWQKAFEEQREIANETTLNHYQLVRLADRLKSIKPIIDQVVEKYGHLGIKP